MNANILEDLRLYRPAEAASLIGVSTTSVRSAARSGNVQLHHRVTGRLEIRFSADQLPALRTYLISDGTTVRSPKLSSIPAAPNPQAEAALLLADIRSLRR